MDGLRRGKEGGRDKEEGGRGREGQRRGGGGREGGVSSMADARYSGPNPAMYFGIIVIV